MNECDYRLQKTCKTGHIIEKQDKFDSKLQKICSGCLDILSLTGERKQVKKVLDLGDLADEKNAYLLGIVASIGEIRENTITLSSNNVSLLNFVRINLAPLEFLCWYVRNEFYVKITNSKLVTNVSKHLNIGNQLSVRTMDCFENLRDNNHFVRGVYDACGNFSGYDLTLTTHHDILYFIHQTCGIKVELSFHTLRFTGPSIIDFLSKIYDYSSEEMRDYRKYCQYAEIFGNNVIPKINVTLVDEKAVLPKKNLASSIGWNLTLIRKDDSASDIAVYDTGLVVKPPFGYYIKIEGTSAEFMLINSPQIVDPHDSNTLKLVLKRIGDQEMSFPHEYGKLILEKMIHAEIKN